VVIGARFDGDSHYRVGRSRRLAISILSRRLSGMTRTRLTDVTSGFRAADRAAIALFARTYPVEYLGDTIESLVIGARAGLRSSRCPSRCARAAPAPPPRGTGSRSRTWSAPWLCWPCQPGGSGPDAGSHPRGGAESAPGCATRNPPRLPRSWHTPVITRAEAADEGSHRYGNLCPCRARVDVRTAAPPRPAPRLRHDGPDTPTGRGQRDIADQATWRHDRTMTATATTLGPGLLPGFAKRPGTPDIPPMPVVGSARVRSLDGLRAIAVTAVIGFHLGVGWLSGGLLGVDMFFVLSGFLITGLLVTERDRTGRISLKGFYSRRARRLLPAMLLVLIVTLVVWRLTADPSRFPGLRGDATATLGYVANWHFAFSGQGYFDQLAPPSPLLHLWSLAVEEQFYLVWPLVVIITLRFGSRRLLLAVAMAGAAASTALISVLSVRGVDANRLYYGTDTRATAVLVGAALALAAPTLVRAAARPRARLAILATGLVAATSLALIMTHTGGQDAWLYRGGFLAVALGVGAAAARPSGSPRWASRLPCSDSSSTSWSSSAAAPPPARCAA